MVRERLRHGFPGILILVVLVLSLAIPVLLFILGGLSMERENTVAAFFFLIGVPLSIALWILMLKGFFMVAPNEAKVMQLFGDYVGTAKITGLRWANPLFKKRKI